MVCGTGHSKGCLAFRTATDRTQLGYWFLDMPGRTDGRSRSLPRWASRALRFRPRGSRQRIAVLVLLLLAVAAVVIVVNRPAPAITMYALIPLVLAVYWFELAGGLAVAALVFVVAQWVLPTTDLRSRDRGRRPRRPVGARARRHRVMPP
jgi:hypothetical protein